MPPDSDEEMPNHDNQIHQISHVFAPTLNEEGALLVEEMTSKHRPNKQHSQDDAKAKIKIMAEYFHCSETSIANLEQHIIHRSGSKASPLPCTDNDSYLHLTLFEQHWQDSQDDDEGFVRSPKADAHLHAGEAVFETERKSGRNFRKAQRLQTSKTVK